jgi:hypothetical protein
MWLWHQEEYNIIENIMNSSFLHVSKYLKLVFYVLTYEIEILKIWILGVIKNIKLESIAWKKKN